MTDKQKELLRDLKKRQACIDDNEAEAIEAALKEVERCEGLQRRAGFWEALEPGDWNAVRQAVFHGAVDGICVDAWPKLRAAIKEQEG